MDAYPSTTSDSLSTLCERLRSERLLVNSEQETLQQLNSTVDKQLAELNQLAWISQQEKLVLRRLVNSDPSVRPENCCQLVASISAARFKEGYRGVGHHAAAISQIFRLLLSSPRAVAEFLSAADHLQLKDAHELYTTEDLCRSVFNMLYGSSSFPGDERNLLDVLANLITLQLVTSPEPRKLLRKGNTAFSRLYHLFTEQLFSAKVFLTAALHEPIMFLLSQDELFLDTDPSKSPIRFPVEERRRRFGVDENSKAYKDRVSAHRKIIVEKLVAIGSQFLKAIQAAIPCFPSSIIWLVRQLHTSLLERKRVTKEEAALICTDLIFTYFLCPAITNPEPLGVISDTPISYIARFNLMQVGQILQTLALLPYEQPPTYFVSLLARFDQQCMARIVERILGSESVSIETMFPNIVAGPNGTELYARKACVGSLRDLNVLHAFLRSSAIEQTTDSAISKEVKDAMRRMPEEFAAVDSALDGTGSPSSSEALLRSRPSSSARLRNLAGRVQTAASKGQQRLLQSSPARAREDSSPSKQHGADTNTASNDEMVREVFVFSLGDDNTPLGLEPEEKIMQSFRSTRKHRSSENATEKKTRFMATESVISDRTSTEAASDDEEEGAGSVSSSLNDNADEVDVEDVEADNFSDVVPISANVSGRGSPSLSGERMSGRDTPFSANAAEQNDTATVSSTIAGAANLAVDAKRNLPSLPVTVRKQNPEGLEEKFGKFGLPPTDPSRYRDETYSLVSDSWSTDVVASDNEGLGDSRQDAAQQLFAQNVPPALAAGVAVAFPGLLPHNALAPAAPQVDPNAPPADPPQQNQRLAVAGAQRPARNPSGAPEDRSDTWSLDATASDSEADAAANAANAEQDLLVLDDLPVVREGPAASSATVGGARRTTNAASVPLLRRKSSQPSAELESLPEADVPGPSGILLPPVGNELTSRDRIRRQSSGGSSFYSRSDVDSEFSKDNEEPLINFSAEALPRTASGDMPVEPVNFLADPASPAKRAATYTTSCTLPLQSVSSSTTSSAAVTPKGPQTRNGCYPIPRGLSDETESVPPVPTSSVSSAQGESLAKSHSYAPSGTPPPDAIRAIAGSSGSGRRLNLLHQGLQKVGATLKRNKGAAVSFGQSMTHSATVDDLSSISVAFSRNSGVGVRNSGRARLAESHSVGHIVDVSEENGQASNATINAAERQRLADDILNKYRAMPSPMSSSPANSLGGILLEPPRPADTQNSQPIVDLDQPYYDPTNITQCKAFVDAKRKLRLVLSSAANVPTNGASRTSAMSIGGIIIDAGNVNKNNVIGANQDTHGLTEFLKLLLAESINSQDKTLSAQIREVQRCLAIFDAKGVRKLLRTLKEDHRRRTSYVLYLQHSRITLLQLNSYLGKLSNRIQREKALTNECLIEVLVRFYLEKNEQFLRRFIHEFQLLKANDEKTDAVDRALRYLCERMLVEPMWRSSTQESLDYARTSLERSLMAQIYVFALYPNGDADQSRDDVFFKSMQRLAAAITPDHPELRIPKQYHGECPWPSAQAEIAIINAYKSPRDKMACVVRCCETIENLIILASERGTASADDITPILVYVLLQANPPGLLSNIQYINGFYAARMEGGESYWWTQFTSAVEFIKQMLNKS